MIELLDFVLLGIIFYVVTSLSLILKDKYAQNLAELTKGAKTYTNKQILIGMLILLPLGLYIVLNIPIQYLVVFELIVGTILIGFTLYILTKNKYVLMLGFVYPFLYGLYWAWTPLVMNLVALFIALGAILMLSTYIKPKSMFLIGGLIILYDFYMVYISKDMIEAAHKIVEVELPMYVAVQVTDAPGMILGLGDVLIFSLISLNVIEYYDYDKRSELCFVVLFSTLTVVSLVIAIWITPGGVPATIPIFVAALISMWLFETTNIMTGKKDKPKNTVSLGSD